MEKASWTQNHEKTFEQSHADRVSLQFCVSKQTTKRENRQKTIRVCEESKSSSGRRPSGVTQRTPQIPWLHLHIMTFANPGESWSSKTGTSCYDQQMCPGTFLSARPFVRNRSRTIVQEHMEGQGEQDRGGQEAEYRERCDDERSCADWQTSSWSWHQPVTWTSSLSSFWQQWSSDETREQSDWQPSADWSSSDQPRQRSGWRSSVSFAVTVLHLRGHLQNVCL